MKTSSIELNPNKLVQYLNKPASEFTKEDIIKFIKEYGIRMLNFRYIGGDGFVGGVLYAILKGWEPENWIRFGWATGAMAATFLTDYAQPADEEQVWSIWEGNARVKR